MKHSQGIFVFHNSFHLCFNENEWEDRIKSDWGRKRDVFAISFGNSAKWYSYGACVNFVGRSVCLMWMIMVHSASWNEATVLQTNSLVTEFNAFKLDLIRMATVLLRLFLCFFLLLLVFCFFFCFIFDIWSTNRSSESRRRSFSSMSHDN